MGSDRRRSPRIVAPEPMHAFLFESDVCVSIVEMSLSGFLAESPIALEPGTVHTLRVVLNAEAVTLDVSARCVHSRRRDGAMPVTFECGFAIVNLDHPAVGQGVQLLFDRLASVLEIH